MITVRFYGLLRLDSGVKELSLEASSVKQLFRELEIHTSGIFLAKDLCNCVIMVNGKAGTVRTKLYDGDTVWLLSPVSGG